MQLVLPGSCAEGEQVIPVRSFDSSRACNESHNSHSSGAGWCWLAGCNLSVWWSACTWESTRNKSAVHHSWLAVAERTTEDG